LVERLVRLAWPATASELLSRAAVWSSDKWLTGGTSKARRELVEKIIIDEKTIIIKLRRAFC